MIATQVQRIPWLAISAARAPSRMLLSPVLSSGNGTVTPLGSPLNWRPTNPAFGAELTTGQLHELDDSAARHDSPPAFYTERLQGEPPSSIHAVVRTHPLTQRRALYVKSGYTTRIVELADRESNALLRMLFDHVAYSVQHQLRVRWQAGGDCPLGHPVRSASCGVRLLPRGTARVQGHDDWTGPRPVTGRPWGQAGGHVEGEPP